MYLEEKNPQKLLLISFFQLPIIVSYVISLYCSKLHSITEQNNDVIFNKYVVFFFPSVLAFR